MQGSRTIPDDRDDHTTRRGLPVRSLLVVAFTLLAAVAVIAGALGLRSLAAAGTVPAAAAAPPPIAAGLTAIDAGAEETVLTPERADPVGQELPAAVGRTAALVVLLGAVLLLRRHPAAASAGPGRSRPPRSASVARSALPADTPGLLRV